ncbi:MAG: hypothetical protein IJU12_00715 [Clostridia bacterium]|nr:hypothetical protein [Clostridia bacterium]
MKKLLALVLALMLALGCAAAVAEEAAPAYGLDTKLQLTLNHDLGPMLAGMITGNYDEKISEAVMDVLDSVYLDVACGGNVVDMALMGNDYPLTSVVGVADEAGVTLVGDLFPHYALRVEYADLQAAMEELSKQLNLSMGDEADSQMPQLSEEEMQALMADLAGYGEDIDAFLASVQDGMVVAEDGSAAQITLTSQQLVGLAESLLNRLSADEVLKPYLQMLIDRVNAQQPEDQKVTLEQALAAAAQKVQEFKAAEDTELAVVTTSQQEDGSAYVELNIVNKVLVAANTMENGLDATVLICQKGITDAEAQLNGIMDGTNAEDMAVQLSVRSAEDENDVANTAFGMDFLYGGVDVGLMLNNAQTGAGTLDYVSHTVGSLSVNLLGGDVLQLDVVTMADDIPAAPELGDRAVLNVAKLTEEETQALVKDVATYGVPALAAACVQGMPDQVAALVELGIQAKDLSFLPGSQDQSEESYDYGYDTEDDSYEEEPYEDDGIDLTGTWTAPDGTVLILNADSTFTLIYCGKETQGTWEKPFNGSVSLDTEHVGVYWDYTETTISGTIGFDWLDFTR